MKEIHQEISEELYNEYRAMRYPERSAVIKSTFHLSGYTDTDITDIDYRLTEINSMLFIPLGIVAIDKIAVSADYRPYMPLQRSKSIIIRLQLKRRIRANITQIEVYKNEL